ncbi:acyl carrier protein [Streptosporangium sp. NPDC000396]|uniref:acyl carrier protein n=1 Tax=Streptosporangium sp. NPDC000396 TaxID=3366185 RepID=UPI0036A18CA5
MVDGEAAVLDELREILVIVMELDGVQIEIDASFHEDLEMDSLQKIEVITRVEKSFGVTFEPEEAAEMNALADVIAFLRGTP